MSRTLGRVQRGGSPFAGGGGHTLGHTLCVSTPHPAYKAITVLRLFVSVWKHDFFEIFSVLFVVFCVIGLMEK